MRYRGLIFSTSTILGWQKIIGRYGLHEIIYDTWTHFVFTDRLIIHAYVIMPNHIHWIYQLKNENDNPTKVKHSLLSFTSKKIITALGNYSRLNVNKASRKQQVWKSTKDFEILYPSVLRQKMRYIHLNPVRANLSESPEKYLYSSAKSYSTGVIEKDFLTLI